MKIVRSYHWLKYLPVIVLTGMSDCEMAQRVLQFNIKTVLTKGSASFDEISAAITNRNVPTPRRGPLHSAH